jgi:hypothetical protein
VLLLLLLLLLVVVVQLQRVLELQPRHELLLLPLRRHGLLLVHQHLRQRPRPAAAAAAVPPRRREQLRELELLREPAAAAAAAAGEAGPAAAAVSAAAGGGESVGELEQLGLLGGLQLLRHLQLLELLLRRRTRAARQGGRVRWMGVEIGDGEAARLRAMEIEADRLKAKYSPRQKAQRRTRLGWRGRTQV